MKEMTTDELKRYVTTLASASIRDLHPEDAGKVIMMLYAMWVTSMRPTVPDRFREQNRRELMALVFNGADELSKQLGEKYDRDHPPKGTVQ
jgi:hypothetical protein